MRARLYGILLIRKFPFPQIAFQEEREEIGKGVEAAIEADVPVAELDAIPDVGIPAVVTIRQLAQRRRGIVGCLDLHRNERHGITFSASFRPLKSHFRNVYSWLNHIFGMFQRAIITFSAAKIQTKSHFRKVFDEKCFYSRQFILHETGAPDAYNVRKSDSWTRNNSLNHESDFRRKSTTTATRQLTV